MLPIKSMSNVLAFFLKIQLQAEDRVQCFLPSLKSFFIVSVKPATEQISCIEPSAPGPHFPCLRDTASNCQLPCTNT